MKIRFLTLPISLALAATVCSGGLAMAADTATPNPNQAVIDEAAAAKAVADAQAAAANALKAQYDAEAAAAKAKYGDIPSSGYTGTATAATSAGGAEATLLGAKSLQCIAKQIAEQVGRVESHPAPLLLFGSTGVPDFQALTAFKAQSAFLKSAYNIAKQQAPEKAAHPETVAAVGFALDALNKVLSFAKTDYTFAAVDTVGTDAMLLNAVAAQLAAKRLVVQMPALYSAELDNAVNTTLGDITDLFTLASKARRNQHDYEDNQAKAEAAKPVDAAKVDAAKKGVAAWKSVADTIDAWSKASSTSDDKGNVPLATVIRQSNIKQKLDQGAAMLVVQVHKSGGTTYTKKNLWSSLGANPFFVMGGAVAGYTLISGKEGNVLASGLLPWHGGYYSVDAIQSAVNAKDNPEATAGNTADCK